MSDCVDRMALVRWILEDLSVEEMTAITDHLSGCSACKARAERIREGIDDFAPMKTGTLSAIHGRMAEVRAERERRRFLRPSVIAAAAIAASLVVVFFVASPLDREMADAHAVPDDIQQPVRYKGEMSCKVFVKRGDRQFKATPGKTLRAGDRLRFVVTTDTGGYLSVFSVDGRGRPSPFYPDTLPDRAPEPMLLAGSGDHELPDAVELDDSPGQETIVVLFSQARFDRRELVRAIAPLAAGGRLEAIRRATAGRGVHSRVFRFLKAGPAQ